MKYLHKFTFLTASLVIALGISYVFAQTDENISQLTEVVPAGEDLVAIVDDPSGTPATRRSTVRQIWDAGWAASTTVPSITTLVNLVSIQGRTVTLADAGANAIWGWDDIASAYENLTAAEVLTIVGGAANDFDGSGDVTIAVADISNLGVNVGTWLTTPTSANILAAVTGDTGTGALVFGTSPTFTTGVDLPTGAINAATEISDDIITHAQILDSDQADTKCIWFENPTAVDDFKSIWANKTANDFQLTELWAESNQTVTFMLQVDDGTPADIDTVDLAPAAGEAEDTVLNGDTVVAAGEELDLDLVSVANTPTYVSICWTGNWID